MFYMEEGREGGRIKNNEFEIINASIDKRVKKNQ